MQSVKSDLQSIFHQYDDIQELFFQGDISSFDINACDSHGKTLLHHACEYGLTEGVSILLVNNAQMDVSDEKGYTPLHYAYQNNHIPYGICKILIQRDPYLTLPFTEGGSGSGSTLAVVTSQDKCSRTMLHYACIHGDFDIVDNLLKAGADPCAQDKLGNNPMHYACENGHLQCVRQLIATSQNPNGLLQIPNNDGITPLSMKTHSGGTILHIACENLDVYVATKLLEAGADTNSTDEFGFTPLMRAVVSTSKPGITTNVVSSIITALCNSKCSVNAAFVPSKPSDPNVYYCEGSTALHMAIDEWTHDRLYIKLLVDNGAALDARDVHGRTPLHIASMRGHHRLIKLLASSPEPFHFKDNDGCTPLYYACKNSHLHCIGEFMIRIPDVFCDFLKVANEYGDTPLSVQADNDQTILHVACEKGHLPIVKKLLEVGANPNVTDILGCTPLHYACKNSHLECVSEFIVQIPDVICDLMNVANNDGTTPLSVRAINNQTILHVACTKGDLSTVKKALEAGADPNSLDGSTFTPLMLAVQHVDDVEAADIIGILCEFKCNPNIQTSPLSRSLTALHLACELGKEKCVEMLVAKGANLLVRTMYGSTPLHLACKGGYYTFISSLITEETLEAYDHNNLWTPLHYACWYHHIECARRIVVGFSKLLLHIYTEYDLTFHSLRDQEGRTILHYACLRNDVQFAENLLNLGADPNVQDNDGATPLMSALQCNGSETDMDLLSLLLSLDWKPDIKDNNGCTPLYYACKNSHLKCIQAFIDQCPDIMGDLMNIANNDDTTPLSARTGSGGTILHVACEKGDINLVKKLLEAGADPNVTDEFGFTPLMRVAVSTSKSGITTNVVSSIITALCNSTCSVNASFVPSKPSDSHVHYYKGSTALHMAIDEWTDNRLCVQALVDNGAALDARDVHGRTPLHIASIQGYHCLIKPLGRSPESFHFKDNDGCTPLHYACKNSHLEFIREYIVQIPDVICDLFKISNKYGDTPLSVQGDDDQTILHVACEKGDLPIVKKLLEAGADPSVTDILGCTPLHYACKNSHLECVSECIVQIPDVICDLMNVANNDGTTPLSVRAFNDQTILHVACEKGDLPIVKKVLEAGADPNSLDGSTFTPLMLAVQHVDDVEAADIVGILCEFKCNLNIEMSPLSRSLTALHLACELGKEKCVEMLIAKGANVLVRTEGGLTPLHLACEGGHHTVISSLITEETLNAYDYKHWTPLHYACGCNHFECARRIVVGFSKLFLQTHTEYNLTFPNLRDQDGKTILHHACLRHDIQFVENLLNLGADPNLQDNNGATPLMSALLYHDSNVDMNLLSLLLSMDWKPDIKDNSGHTALHYSVKCNDIRIPLMLISAGCDVTAVDNFGQTFADLIPKKSLKLMNKQLLRIDRRQIICVVGYPKCGKTTIIAAFQQAQQKQQNKFHRLTARRLKFNTRVTLDNSRTSGIDTKVITTKGLGSLIFFDFAGQSEYYASHLAFLESALSAKGSTITFIMMVDLRCSEEDRITQCKEWLFPIKSILKDHNMLNVILIGSHFDQVETVSTSTSSLRDNFWELKRTLGTPQMQFIGCWGMDCRQLLSKGMTNLQNYLQSTCPVHSTSAEVSQVPLGACLLFDRLKKSENPPLAITPSKIIDKLKDGCPPIPLTVKYIDSYCQDLAASGLVLYIPNREDAGESWLILEMEEILSRIHGKLFAPDSAEFPMHHKNLANQFGLVHVDDLTLAFKDSPLDPEMIQKLLTGMEFCHPVDSSLMTEGILDVLFSKVSANADIDKRQSCSISTPAEKYSISNWLFFPSLVKVNEESVVLSTESDIPGDDCHRVCWELSTVKPHFLHPRFQQAVFIRLACNHVQKHKSDLSTVEEHSCTVSKNAMSWSTIHGVDVCIQIMHKSTIKVLARGRAGVKVSSLMEMLSSVVSDVLTVRANHAPGVDAYSVFRVMEKGTPGEHTVPVFSIIDVVQAGGMYVNSRERPPKLVSLKDLFLDWEISVTLLEEMVSISEIYHEPTTKYDVTCKSSRVHEY